MQTPDSQPARIFVNDAIGSPNEILITLRVAPFGRADLQIPISVAVDLACLLLERAAAHPSVSVGAMLEGLRASLRRVEVASSSRAEGAHVDRGSICAAHALRNCPGCS